MGMMMLATPSPLYSQSEYSHREKLVANPCFSTYFICAGSWSYTLIQYTGMRERGVECLEYPQYRRWGFSVISGGSFRRRPSSQEVYELLVHSPSNVPSSTTNSECVGGNLSIVFWHLFQVCVERSAPSDLWQEFRFPEISFLYDLPECHHRADILVKCVGEREAREIRDRIK